MNKFFLTGNLTRNPELTKTASGVSVCRFGLAVKRAYRNADGERQTDFFNVIAWRGVGECVAKYCKKGNRVIVTGELRSYEDDEDEDVNSYEDDEDVKWNAVEIVAQDVEMTITTTAIFRSDHETSYANGDFK